MREFVLINQKDQTPSMLDVKRKSCFINVRQIDLGSPQVGSIEADTIPAIVAVHIPPGGTAQIGSTEVGFTQLGFSIPTTQIQLVWAFCLLKKTQSFFPG